MRRGGAAATVLGGLMAVGCPDPGDYACVDDSDCDRGGQFGQCLIDRACGYPVPTDRCPSGLIRSPNAATAPGECVSEEDATTTGDADCESLQVSVDVTALMDAGEGYPLLLRVSDPSVADLLRSRAANLSIEDAAGTPLAVQWQLDAPTPHAWVRLPDPAQGNASTLLIRWDGAASPTDVWRDFDIVWHFDGADALDAVRGQSYGVLSGDVAAPQSVPAVVGHGLQFDGIDDVLSVDPPPVAPSSAFTLSFWARYDDPAGERVEYVSSLTGHSLHPRCYRNTAGRVSCQTRVGDVTETVTGPEHAFDQQRHVVLMRDEAGQVRLYVDGQLEDTHDWGAEPLESGDAPFLLGSGEVGPSAVTLDEVRLAPRALPPAWLAYDAALQATASSPLTAIAQACD